LCRRLLKRIKEAPQDESVNLIPLFVEAVKADVTLGEICRVLKEVFGEYSDYGTIQAKMPEMEGRGKGKQTHRQTTASNQSLRA